MVLFAGNKLALARVWRDHDQSLVSDWWELVYKIVKYTHFSFSLLLKVITRLAGMEEVTTSNKIFLVRTRDCANSLSSTKFLVFLWVKYGWNFPQRPPPGQRNVAVVERWPLVEVRLYVASWNFENEPQDQSKISNCSLLQKLSTKNYSICCSKQENLELGEKRKQQELLQQVCIILPSKLCFY